MFDVQTGSGCAARDSQASCSVQSGNPCGGLPNCTGGFSKDESHSIYDRVPESGTFIAFQNGLDSTESTTRGGIVTISCQAIATNGPIFSKDKQMTGVQHRFMHRLSLLLARSNTT